MYNSGGKWSGAIVKAKIAQPAADAVGRWNDSSWAKWDLASNFSPKQNHRVFLGSRAFRPRFARAELGTQADASFGGAA